MTVLHIYFILHFSLRTTYVHTVHRHSLEQPGIRLEWNGEVRHQMENNKLLLSESRVYN